jgi:hypothetical protein
MPRQRKPNDLSRSLIALDMDTTLIAVVELSLSSWLVAGIVPGVERQPLKKLKTDENALLTLLNRWRDDRQRDQLLLGLGRGRIKRGLAGVLGPGRLDDLLEDRHRHPAAGLAAAERAPPAVGVVVADPDPDRDVIGEADEPGSCQNAHERRVAIKHAQDLVATAIRYFEQHAVNTCFAVGREYGLVCRCIEHRD